MECKWHPGQEAKFTCIKCGQSFCRECVAETKGSHYCPDCYQAELTLMASRMGAREAPAKPDKKAKAEKETSRKSKRLETRAPEPKERVGFRRARAKRETESPLVPAEVVSPPLVVAVPPIAPAEPRQETLAAVEAPPAEKKRGGGREKGKKPKPIRKHAKKRSEAAAEKPGGLSEPGLLSPEEKSSFWGDMEHSKRTRRASRAEPVPEPLAVEPVEESPRVATAAAKSEESAAVREEKKPLSPEGVQAAYEAADGWGELEEEEFLPPAATRKRHAARGARLEVPFSMQVPEDYDGQLTDEPSYVKAVLWGLLAGVLLAGAYAGLEYWLHSGRWIFGWIIGVAVGFGVALGSGRHFNWKLGLVAAGIAVFCLCLGQVVFFMLDVRFNKIIPLHISFIRLLKDSLVQLGKEFGSLWLLLFVLTGGVAFLLTFRPWPVRFQSARPAAAHRAKTSS